MGNETNTDHGQHWSSGTLCIQGGYAPNVGEPRTLPIAQTTTYKYEDLDQVERLFALKESGYKYTRTGNPTVAAFEQKVTQLEGGVGAVATASGQAATLLAIVNLCRAGDHIVSSSTIYGGSYTLFSHTLAKYGIETTFVDPEAPLSELQKAVRPNTKALFAETLGNPGLGILDFGKFATLARENGIALVVDNTLATPYLCNPFSWGANIVVHSATKYIDGHATSIGGIVVDGGNFNWDNGKFPELVEPDPSYHGVRYLESFGKAAYISKARAQFLRDFGACQSPFNAFLLNLGLETLHLRMERHGSNALSLAQFLQGHPAIEWVVYPGLAENVGRERIQKYFLHPNGSGVLTFGLKGGHQAARAFVKALKLAALVVHVGDARTSVLHPASSTHSQMTADEQRDAGITPDMIRVSVGIEDSPDIVADFSQALEAASGFDSVSIRAAEYFDTPALERVKESVAVELSSHVFLPQVIDLKSDWVSHVATPAFKLLRRQGAPIESFCSIGTGAGLDVLSAIEVLGAHRVGLTDVLDEVVQAASRNIQNNLKAPQEVVLETGFGDLLEPLRHYGSRYDVIYENLPNVPIPENEDVTESRKSAVHLAPRREVIPELVRHQLLDLHYLALVQAKEFLAPGGVVLSTLGARVPLAVFLELGKLAGLESTFLTYTWKVQAEAEDVLSGHVAKQREGLGPFHFYPAAALEEAFANISLEKSGRNALEIEAALAPHRLDALAAYEAWKAGTRIGHTVAVIASRRIG